jgi:hypothetical protein
VNARSAKARPTRDRFEKAENLRASAPRRHAAEKPAALLRIEADGSIDAGKMAPAKLLGDKGEIGRRVSGPLTGSHRPRRK